MIVNNGQWWLPADRNRTVVGDLAIGDDRSLRLELDARLLPWSDRNKVVWGETEGGRPVTLLGCWVRSYGTATQNVHVHAALVGVHIESADDTVFSQAVVSLSNLTDWASRGHARPPLPAKIANPQDGDVKLSLRRVADEVELVIESEIPRRWTGYETTIQAFQDLLTLAGNADCRIESTVLSTADGPVEVWMKDDTVLEHRWHPVFVLGTVPAGFISDWLSLRDELGMSGSVLFSLDYGGRGYFQNKLFNAASAAEGIHQILCPDSTAITAAEHKALKEHIKTMPDGSAREWALSAIHRNQTGFATRMHELAAIPDGDAVATLLHDQSKWVTWMTKARNAIGHSAWDGMNKIPREVQPALIHVTKTLMHLVILEKLGLSASQHRSAVAVSYCGLRQRYDDYFVTP